MPPLLRMAVNGSPVAWQVRCCDTFWRRALGQLGASPAAASNAWRLQPCRAVHTFFLPAPIDVAFCDARGSILRIIAPLRPWRCAVHRAAHSAWELPAGAAARVGLKCGDRLTLCR